MLVQGGAEGSMGRTTKSVVANIKTLERCVSLEQQGEPLPPLGRDLAIRCMLRNLLESKRASEGWSLRGGGQCYIVVHEAEVN